MKMNRKGFTLIELLAVILILGIIALIAIPTVNKVLQESRVGAWQSTGNQMTKSAENYYQLRVIKDGAFINDFTKGATSEGKFVEVDANGNISGYDKTTAYTGNDLLNGGTLEKAMKAALEVKGDMPKFQDIEVFTIDNSGTATLKFKTANAYCLSTSSTFTTVAEYNAATMNTSGVTSGILTKGGNIKCISKS